MIFDHGGPLTGRGKQALGQDPSKWDAPGVRASEQGAHDARWITSEQLKRAIDIGRIETQTPAIRGRIIDLQARTKHQPNPNVPHDAWEAPHRAFRVKVRFGGNERWLYCDRFDNTGGGMGPADMSALTGGLRMDPSLVAAMLERGQLLAGDDPAYVQKVRAGRILVWGGSPTGAWAAEPSVHAPGSRVTVLGDTRAGGPASGESWPEVLAQYREVMDAIAEHHGHDVPADLIDRLHQVEAKFGRAHKGSLIERNREPGATYDRNKPLTGRKPDDVQIEFGTPSRIVQHPDGRVLVTIGTDANAPTTEYDQVVIAHGQDPGAPGGTGRTARQGRGGEVR